MTLPIRARARSFAALAVFCLATAWVPFAAAQQLSIADVSIVEGNSGSKLMTFTIQLSAVSATVVKVDVATSNGTATAGSDYLPGSTPGLRFPAGTTSKNFVVSIFGDTASESNETLKVDLSNAIGATISDAQAIGTITNDDGSLPSLSVNDVSITEGDSGSKWVTFTVGLSLTSTTPVEFNIWTTEGTATNGDFMPTTATHQVIEPGYSVKDFQVQINGDTVVESDEVFHVFLEAVSGATVADPFGDATILNDDSDAPKLSLSDATVVEGSAGNSALMFEARLSKPATGPVSFDFATSNGTASAGTDYDAQSLVGKLVIPVGQTSIRFPVVVKGDFDVEASEYLNATISNAVGAPISRASATGLVWNDDGNILITTPSDPLKQSTGSTGFTSNDQSISSDGRFVAFISGGNDLAPGQPTNSFHDIFLRDLRTGETRLVSVGSNGAPTNGPSLYPSVSADGRYVVFESYADNIVPGDNATGDVFRRDMYTGTTELVSVGLNGTSNADYGSDSSEISANGRFIVFRSAAPDIVADDTNGTKTDVFVRDMQTGTTTLVSVATAGPSAPVNGSQGPTISADGRYVTFASDDPNIVAGDTDGLLNAFIRDQQTGTTTKVVFDSGFRTYGAALSGNGRYLLFAAQDPALLDNQIYVRDLQTNAIEKVNVRFDGQTIPQFGGGAYGAMISDDGRYVSFVTHLDGLVEDDNNGQSDVFVRDTVADSTWRAPGLNSQAPALSADGRFLVYGTISNTMSVGDGNWQEDSFRVEVPQIAMPSMMLIDYWVFEGNSGTKQLTLTVALLENATTPVTFDVDTFDGIAGAPSDYVAEHISGLTIPVGEYLKTFTITIVGDSQHEPDENLDVYLSNVRGASVRDGHALVIIGNDDSKPVSISVGDASVTEGDNGTKVMDFTVSLSAPAPSTVSFDIASADGTATAGSDFVALALAGQTIAAGQSSKTVSVTINGDTTVEPDETFTVNVSNVSGATMADASATGTITNDDTVPTPTLSIGDVSITEGNAGSKLATFTVTLSAAASTAVTFNIATANGSAVAPGDYTAKSLNGQSITAGSLSKTFTVSIKGDTVSEPDETFNVNITNVAGAAAGDVQGVGTITNDDAAATPTLSIADASVSEGNSGTKTLTFSISLSSAASGTVSYDIATGNGTATSDSDYVASSLIGQTISAGATSKTFVVTINGDATTEANETFTVTLSNASGATLGDGQATGTISNDDGGSGPTLSIGDVSIVEGNSLTKQATFTVTLSAAASGPVTYNIATADGTAVSGTDYVAKSLSGESIPAGSLSKTFTVGVRGDRLAEPNETFLVNVSSVVGATVADGQATGTISNDDAAIVSVARFNARGLYDDLDDGNREPVLTTRDYAALLQDTAQKQCARTTSATVVAVDGVENPAALRDLADAANGLCTGTPRYQAVMGKGTETGFLVEATSATDARGVQVLEAPSFDAKSGLTTLTVQGSGHERPLTLLMPAALPANAAARNAQLKALAQRVRAELKADPEARLVLVGGVTVAGLLDLTAREWAKTGSRSEPLAGERVLVSQPLLVEFGATHIEFAAPAENELPAQVLQLKR